LSRQCQISQRLLYNGSKFITRLAQNRRCKLCTCSEVGSSRVLSAVFTCEQNRTESRKKGAKYEQSSSGRTLEFSPSLSTAAQKYKHYFGMQQMVPSAFCVAIDYSVNIFCFLQTQFVSSLCGLKYKDTPAAKHNPLLGVTKAQGKAACCTDCEMAA